MSKIDKIFKDKLHDYSGSYSQEMWDKIELELHPTKKKNRGLLFLLLGFLLLSVVGLSYYLIDNKQLNENIDDNDFITTIEQNETASLNISNTDNNTIYDTVEKNNTETNINSKPATNPSNNTITSRSRKSNNYLFNNSKKGTRLSTETNNQTITSLSNSNSIVFNSLSSKVLQGERTIVISKVDRLNQITELASIEKNNTLEKLSRQLNRNRTECPSFSKEVAGVMIDLYYSHEYGIRSLGKQLANDGVDDYINIRNNTEKSLYSFSAGIRLAFMLPNNMGLKTGLNYSQINEKFEYQDPESIKTQKIEVTEYQYENGMVVDSMVTTQTIQVPGEDRIKVYNKYRSMDIPILFSYEWAGTHGFYFSGNGGVLLNFAFNQKGMIIGDDNLQPQWISSSLPERYKAFDSSLGLSLYGSLGLYYNLNEHFDLMLEPNVRVNLKSITLADHALSQKYIVPGFITGLRVKF